MTAIEKLRFVSKLLLGAFLLTLCFTNLNASDPSQVSESEINQLAREAVANRSILPKSAATADIDFLTLILKGGVFMIPIGIMSLVVVTFFFDRLFGLRSGKIMPGGLVRNLHQLMRQGEIDPSTIYKTCGEYPSAAARVFRSIVVKTGRPQSEIQTASAEALQREVDSAHHGVRWLSLSSGIAPLLGLLGTIWGLIRAFHDSAQLTAGQNRAEFLAVGIYEALVTTMAGLIVAIVAAIATHFFESRIVKVFGRVEELAAELMMRLERYEGRIRFEPIGRELAARDISQSHSSSTVTTPSVPTSHVPPPATRLTPKTEVRPRTTRTE